MRGAGDEAENAGGFCRELEAAGCAEIETGSIGDDGDRGAAAEREIRRPETLRR